MCVYVYINVCVLTLLAILAYAATATLVVCGELRNGRRDNSKKKKLNEHDE